MIEQARQVAKAIQTLDAQEQHGELTKLAQEIATNSLATFSGELLKKALTISAAIVDFEIELTKE